MRGFYKKEIVAENVYKIIEVAVEIRAEILVIACPLCINFDSRQEMAMRLHPEMKGVPILYFTQLMALSFGCEDILDFQGNRMNPYTVLKKKELLGGF